MEDSKKRSRHLVGLSEASPACGFRLALFVLERARVFRVQESCEWVC